MSTLMASATVGWHQHHCSKQQQLEQNRATPLKTGAATAHMQ